MANKEPDIRDVLCGPVASSPKDADTVTFLAIVRPGTSDRTFGVLLDNGRRWIDIDLAGVSAAREHGSVEVDGTRCKLAAVTLPRPRDAGVWFDLFKDSVASLAEAAVAAANADCGCGGGQEAGPGPVFMQPRKPIMVRSVNADCYRCNYIDGQWRCVWICPGPEPK